MQLTQYTEGEQKIFFPKARAAEQGGIEKLKSPFVRRGPPLFFSGAVQLCPHYFPNSYLSSTRPTTTVSVCLCLFPPLRYNPRHTHTHKWPPSLPPKEKRGESWNRDKRTHFLYVFLFSCGRQARRSVVVVSFPPPPLFYSSPSSHSFVRQEVGNSTISTYFFFGTFNLPENCSNGHAPSRQCW